MAKGPTNLPWFAWQPGALLAVSKLEPYERGLVAMATDAYWINGGEDIDWSDGPTLVDKFSLEEEPTPSQLERAKKAWRSMKEYLDGCRDKAKAVSDQNRANVNKRYDGTAKSSSKDAPFNTEEHQEKEIWPVWEEIQAAFPGDRIRDSDFLVFEECVGSGVDPGYVLAQSRAYQESKPVDMKGFGFEKFIQEGIFKRKFTGPKGNSSVPTRIQPAHEKGMQEYLNNRR